MSTAFIAQFGRTTTNDSVRKRYQEGRKNLKYFQHIRLRSATMKVRQANCRVTTFVLLLVFLALCVAAAPLRAQTVTASPAALSYGIPTGTTPPLVTSQYVTVTTSGSGSATLSGFTMSGTNSADFSIDGNSCTTAQTAPAICLISVQFTSTQPPGTLETATLSFTANPGNTQFNIPLSGAYGAIKLFNETNVNSDSGLTFPYTIASNTQNLACPANPTGKLSGKPDGSGYILVDDLVTMATGAPGSTLTPVNNSTPPGNICTVADTTGPDCFTNNYNFEAFSNPGFFVTNPNPDAYANPNNGLLPGFDPTNGAGGLAPIDVSAFLTTPAVEQVLFTLLQPGSQDPPPYYANSTLFLVTNCTPQALVPGGSITGNPRSEER